MRHHPTLSLFVIAFTLSCWLSACKKNSSTDAGSGGAAGKQDSAVAIFLTNAYYNYAVSGFPEKVTLTAYRTNGTIKWQIPTISNYYFPTMIQGNKDVLYFSSAFVTVQSGNYTIKDTFNAVDANTGAYLWHLPTSNIRISNYYLSNDILYCTYYKTNSSYIGALNVRSGATIWEQPLSTAYAASFMTVRENVMYYIYYASNTVANVVAFDLTTRTMLWRTALTGSYGNLSDQLTFSENYIVLTNGVQNLQVLNKTNGTALWTKTGNNFLEPQVAGNYVYAPNKDQGLHCYDLQTGNPLWQWGKRPWFKSSLPYVDNNKLFFAGSDSTNFILSLNSITGAINWRKKPQYFLYDNVAVGNKLYGVIKQLGSTTYRQRLIVYDTETGNAKDSVLLSGSDAGKPCILTSKGDIVSNSP